MKKLNFNIHIHASPEKVWDVLWTDASYREWVSVFYPGSHALSDWQEGSRILFVEGSGQNGMFSKIARLIPNEYMSFQHLGEWKNGAEAPGESAWENAFENYRLSATENGTDLQVEIDAHEPHAEYFQDIFPKALDKVKALAEQ